MKAKKKAPAKKKAAPKKSAAKTTTRAKAAPKKVTYKPQPISGTGWPPFRYPPI